MRMSKNYDLKGLRVAMLLLAGLLSVNLLIAQGTVTGVVVDQTTKETLVGVTVNVQGKGKSTVTGPDGSFKLNVEKSSRVELSYVGYLTKIIEVNAGQALGQIELSPNQVIMKEIVVTANNIAIDRKTPVAVSTLRAQAIEERIGNKEFPELLKTTPSTYVTKLGGGFGDSRINVRGFNQANTAVMINGVPVNDMENGWVYWSNWAGLSDIATSMQVQRGLGATKLSIAAVGGNINVVTKATEMKQGGLSSATIGNDGYMKYTAGYSTGKAKNGLAFSLLGSYTGGAGYIDGTSFKSWNYFATLGWEINSKHTVTLTATGAPQWHNQRTAGIAYQNVFGNPNDPTAVVRGIKYNDSWGYLNGKEFSFSKNFYHKPIANLNYYWKINDKTNLNAVLYGSVGRGGGTGSIGTINGKSGFALPKDANGLIRFDDITKWNSGTAVADFGTTQSNPAWTMPGAYQGKYVSDISNNGVIRRASMNSHNWVGAIVNGTHELSSKLALNAGVDLRYYKGLHYRRVEDGLGTVAYYETKDLNNAPGKYVAADDQKTAIDYNNDGIVKQAGGYLSAEYNTDKFSAFASGALSNTQYQRIDHFLYNKTTDPRWESTKKNFLGYITKGGVNYRITKQHNIFANIGYFEKAPLFNIVWPNNNNHELGRNLTNEKIFSAEAGYGFRSKIVSVNINAYRTEWKDKNFIINYTDPSSSLPYRANITGLIALHKGIELEATSRPINKLEINAMGSLGDWRWKNDVTTDVYNDNNTKIGTTNLYTKNLKVGDAAQTTANLSAAYEFFKGFKVRGSYFYAADVYANFKPEDRNTPAKAGIQPWKLPSYGLVDGMMQYIFNVEKKKITLRLNIDNIFDKQYIAESTDDIQYNPADPKDFKIGNGGSGQKNRIYAGFGRTWTMGVKVNF